MKRIALNFMAALMLALVPAGTLAGTAYAACGHDSTAKDQVLKGIGDTGTNCDEGENGVTHAVRAAVQILSLVVGIVAVIMIIAGGLKYITSGGEAQKVANAKNTIVYALVGLAVAALAQLIVHFVLRQASVAAGG